MELQDQLVATTDKMKKPVLKRSGPVRTNSTLNIMDDHPPMQMNNYPPLNKVERPLGYQDPVQINFPDKPALLLNSISEGATSLQIHIPYKVCDRDKEAIFERPIKYPPFEQYNLLKITHLAILHSTREDQDYWANAITALKPLFIGSLNLKGVVLSHNVVDDFLPLITKGIKVTIDCSRYYTSTDHIYETSELENLAADTRARINNQYPVDDGYQITVISVGIILYKHLQQSGSQDRTNLNSDIS